MGRQHPDYFAGFASAEHYETQIAFEDIKELRQRSGWRPLLASISILEHQLCLTVEIQAAVSAEVKEVWPAEQGSSQLVDRRCFESLDIEPVSTERGAQSLLDHAPLRSHPQSWSRNWRRCDKGDPDRLDRAVLEWFSRIDGLAGRRDLVH